MKHFFIVLLTVVVWSGVNGQTISIEDCQPMAKENYPQILQYGLIDKGTNFKTEILNTNYLPQISLSAKYTYQSDVTSIPITIPGMTINPPGKDQYGVTLMVDQLIWDGGSTSIQKKISKEQAIVDKRRLDSDIYLLRERVNELYFGIKLLESQININSILIKDLDRSRADIKSLISSGMANLADLNLFEAEFIAAKQKESDLKNMKSGFAKMLSAMIGKNVCEGYEFIMPKDVKISLDDQNMRFEIDWMDSQISNLENQKRLVSSKSLPKLGAFIQLGYSKPGLNMLKDELNEYYYAGARLTWNIGSFYTKKRETSLIKINQQSIENQKQIFQYNINLKKSQHVSDIARLEATLVDDAALIRLREEIVNSSKIKVESGVCSISDYIKDINKLDLARQSKASHQIELLKIKYQYSVNLNK